MPNRVADQTTALIDGILTNSLNNISQSGVIDLILSDHSLIYCTRNTSLPKHIPKLNRISDCNGALTYNHLVRKITRPVWPNGSLLVYELSCCGFEPGCSHLNFRYRACFE